MSSFTLVLGPMFSGKSEHLIRFSQEHKKNICIKPSFDTRYSNHQIVSHSNLKVDALVCDKLSELSEEIKLRETIIIDEVQFFDESIFAEIKKLIVSGKTIIAGGLNLDYKKEEFSTITRLKTIANHIITLTSNCNICNQPAEFTFRKSIAKEQFLLGAEESYEPRCEKCFDQ